MKRAKIVSTIGPSSGDEKTIMAMMKEGLDVARLNFSHGSREDHKRYMEVIRKCSKRLNKPVAILQDLQGIKIRLGKVDGSEIVLKKGKDVCLFGRDGMSDESSLYIRYGGLVRDLKKNDRVLIDDGLVMLKIAGKERGKLRARVIEGGKVSDNKGVNLPDTDIRLSSFTEKDRKDLSFAIRSGIDYVAVSFVRTQNDIRKIKDYIKKKKKYIPVIAKIEKPEALSNIDSIMKVADGIMIARGDLGVEMKPEEIPMIQKELIRKANRAGKIVITATQMLESMTEHQRPTRAEVADVANAILDGSDALMLSGETSSGKYPVHSVRMMRKIIEQTERSMIIKSPVTRNDVLKADYPHAVADAAVGAAHDVKAKVIVAFTHSGYTAGLVSKFRPAMPIIAFATNENVQRNLSILWGVDPKTMKPLKHTDEMIIEVERYLLKNRIVKKDDTVVIVSSSPLSISGKTNLMKLHKIG
jgi:pyruvate kinase